MSDSNRSVGRKAKTAFLTDFIDHAAVRDDAGAG
jgi:hypothetical protein